MIKLQLNKAEAIQKWPPHSQKSRCVLSFALWVIIGGLSPSSSLAVPLTNLTKERNSTVVHWSPEAEAPFCHLRQALCQGPVLVTSDFQKEFLVQTDLLKLGLGAILSKVVG